MVQAKVSYCLCPTWGLLVGATKWSVIGHHLCLPWRCLAEATLESEASHSVEAMFQA